MGDFIFITQKDESGKAQTASRKKHSCTNRNKTSTSISICTCFYSRISVKSVFAVFQFCFVLSSFYLNLNIKRKIPYVSSLGLGFMSVSGKVV